MAWNAPKLVPGASKHQSLRSNTPRRSHRPKMTSDRQKPLIDYLQMTCASRTETPMLHKILCWALNFEAGPLGNSSLHPRTAMPSAELCLQKMLKKTAVELHLQTLSKCLALVSKRPELESQLCQYTYQEPLGQLLITCVPLFSPSAK